MRIVKIAVLGVLTLFILVFWIITHRFTHLPSLSFAIADEYAFIMVLMKMKSTLLSGNIPSVFGYSFFNYGFVYFFGLLLLTLPAMLLGKWAWVVMIPRWVSSVSALAMAWIATRILPASPVLRIVALLGFATMPGFWIYGSWFHPDFLMTALFFGAVWALQRDKWRLGRWYWGGAVFMGAALGVKFQALTFVPFLGLYLVQAYFQVPNRRVYKGLLAFPIVLGVFLLCNPYLLHPEGQTVFLRALQHNLISNATNHGLGNVLSLQDKVIEGIGPWFFLPILVPVVLLVLVYMSARFVWQLRRPYFLDGVAAITLINVGYLFFAVNKAWGHYYITPMLLAWVLVVDFLGQQTAWGIKKMGIWVLATIIMVNAASQWPFMVQHIKNHSYQEAMKKERPRQPLFKRLMHTEGKGTILVQSTIMVDWEFLAIPLESVATIYGPLDWKQFSRAHNEAALQALGIRTRNPFLEKTWIILDKAMYAPAYYDTRADRENYVKAIAIIQALREGFGGYRVVYEDDSLLVLKKGPGDESPQK